METIAKHWMNPIGSLCSLLYIRERVRGIAAQEAATASLQRKVKLIAMRPAVRSAWQYKSKKMVTKTGNDLFIVDNSDDDWKVLNYLNSP